jgi:hypothetical protein
MKIIYLIFTNIVHGLKPYHMSDGRIRKYLPNLINPEKDIVNIGYSKTSFITKHWLINIIQNDILNTQIENEDTHIIQKINDIENYIQHNRKVNDVYLAWMPKCVYGTKDVLFIIVGEYVLKKDIFVIKEVIQSPFWCSEQIDSSELKKSLCVYSKEYVTDLTYLYDNDFRYKLAWNIWNYTL